MTRTLVGTPDPDPEPLPSIWALRPTTSSNTNLNYTVVSCTGWSWGSWSWVGWDTPQANR